MTIKDGSFIIISKGDLLLLVRHAYGKKEWSFPGGGVDKNEPFQTAALRECFEETGYRPPSAILVAKYKSRKHEDQKTHLYHWFVENNTTCPGPENHNEIAEIRFVTIKEAQKLLTMQAQQRFLATYQAYLAKKQTIWKPYSEYLSGEFSNKEIEDYLQLPVVF